MTLWGLQWYSRNHTDGVDRHFMWDGPTRPLLFRSRREARAYALDQYGYIKTRPDLRTEPYGWRVPSAVRVNVTLTAAKAKGETK